MKKTFIIALALMSLFTVRGRSKKGNPLPSVSSAVQGFWFLFATLFLFTPVLAAAVERGIVPVPIRDSGGRQVGLYKESHALVIGVSNYTGGWPRLPGVMDDLREVTGVLEDRGFNVVVVRNPDREMLEKAYNDFINKYGRGDDNRLLFYFAGHGYTGKLAYGGEMGYIVPTDAPDPNRNKNGFLNKAMDMQMFEVYARRVQAKHALFLFDSCFSGSLFALSRAIPEIIQEKTSKPVRQFITAGTSEQTVPDKSIFRRQFVSALRGEADTDKDGYVTASELGQFLETTVTNYSKRSQTPKYGKMADPNLDKGDFVFALNDPSALENNIEALELDRKNLERERQGLADERKRLELETLLAEAKRKLEEEKRRLAEELEKLARLQPPKAEAKPSPGPAGMVKIPGGEYVAGLDPDLALAECRKYYGKCKREWFTDETPAMRTVESFSMDKYEVTQAEFEKVMGNNPSGFKGPNLPVENVTWHEADEYCRKVGKRLPTEWEWEKAAKGGSGTIYPWGNELQSGKANICDMNCEYDWKASEIDDGYKNTSPVGSYPPNGYGLHDMAGNVWEWTASDYRDSDEIKVLRGGSWNAGPNSTRSAFRDYYFHPGRRFDYVGFRCAQ